MTWELLWKIVLVLALAGFTVMAVLVTILGARDVRRMLRGLRESKADDEPGEEE